ncbi:pseudouridine synthase [Russula dissimulans]|nr:pseudouridine synthase [Russula dissimulans]
MMGLGKTSLVARRSRAAESMVSTATQVGCATVLYVDRGVIVLNKPPGLESQGTSRSSTKADVKKDDGPGTRPRVISAFDNVLDGLRLRYDLDANPYPIHRLDKGTTGALILARTKPLARELSRQFRTHNIEKTYLALVCHDTPPGEFAKFPAKEGVITAPLSLHRRGRVRLDAPASPTSPQADSGPELGLRLDRGDEVKVKAARTAWEVLASSDVVPLSLMRLHPDTGVKHQLRVHMAHVLGVPILGDPLYESTTSSPQVLERTGVPEGRLFLHASSISFWRYRRDGLRKRFRLTIAAPLPADFAKVCQDVNLSLPEGVIEGGAFIDGERLEGDGTTSEGGQWVGEPFSI